MFLVLQTAVIGVLLLHFSGRSGGAVTFSAVYVAILAVLLSGLTPVNVLTLLQSACVPAVILGKSIQIAGNYRNGSTGQLSATTVMLQLAGSMARIFTSLQETGDALLVVTFIVTATLNGITAAQVLYYWDSADKKKKVKKN